MKIAFLILAHKNPKQLGDLVRRLDSSSSLFFIHIDVKVDINPFKKEIEKLKNVFWVKREDGRWGDIGIVKATLNALVEAQDFSNDICHYVLLSGQDYPLKSIEEIVLFFENNQKSSFIEHQAFPIKRLNYSGFERIKCYSTNVFGKRQTVIPLSWRPKFNFKGHLLNIILLSLFIFKKKRFHPSYAMPYYGSQWWVLNDTLSKQVLNFIKLNPEFLSYHSSSLLPDELFFQSIVGTILEKKRNFSEEVKVNNENLHYIAWDNEKSHPKTLKLADFEKIRSSNKLFARKFDYIDSKTLVKKINEKSE